MLNKEEKTNVKVKNYKHFNTKKNEKKYNCIQFYL